MSNDKYRWHKIDLANLELPTQKTRILFEVIERGEHIVYSGYMDYGYDEKPSFCNDDHEGYVTKGDYELDKVIAWRYCDSYSKGLPKYV